VSPRGLMQDGPLVLGALLQPMERWFAGKTVRTAGENGTVIFAQTADRARRLGAVLDELRVAPGARVGSIAWNTRRHLELFVGVPASGRVLHTINHRLFREQLAYVVDHAEDDVVFVDRSLLAGVWPVLALCRGVRHVVVMDDGVGEVPDDPRVLDYEGLMGARERRHALDFDDERAAAGLCYTSGTTGDPKGVLYSHRSTILHALMLMTGSGFGVGEHDVIMPIVPMFHVNAWGFPHAAALGGASLSLPGRAMAPAALAAQLLGDRVTIAGAVPTVWRSLVPHLGEGPLEHLRKAICGGSAIPRDLSDAYEALGSPLQGAWGMTETSPLVTYASPDAAEAAANADQADPTSTTDRADLGRTAGRPVPLVELRLRGEAGRDLPWDGVSEGELQVRGPTIASAYFNSAEPATTDDGWLRTGDVATIDPRGWVRIVDRTKDLIKSGGEWISSLELENALTAHPAIAEAAVVATPDERWGERPLAWVVLSPGNTAVPDDLDEFLSARVASWWLPGRVEALEALPLTATGKYSKVALRAMAREG
jgi:fatty-acyl-CoA synthase